MKKWEITLEFIDTKKIPVKFEIDFENVPVTEDVLKIALRNGYKDIGAFSVVQLVDVVVKPDTLTIYQQIQENWNKLSPQEMAIMEKELCDILWGNK